MLKTTLAIGCFTLAMAVPGAGFAQTPDGEGEIRDLELEEARTQMDSARRQLEEAARTIAVQARVLPDAESRYATLTSFYGFGGQGRIGASIVDADGGALVTALTPEGGAEAAGIRVGDVIQSINGVDVTAGDGDPSEAVVDELRDLESGSTVAVIVERGGQSLDFEVETAEGAGWLPALTRQGPNAMVFTAPDGSNSPRLRLNELSGVAPGLPIFRTLGLASSPWADMELVILSESLGRYFETSEGLLVVRSPGDDEIDIQDGDVILSISGRTPNSPEHAIRILSSFESGETIEFSLMRDGRRRSVEYSVPEQTSRRARPAPVAD